MSLSAPSLFTDPEIPNTSEPETSEPADATSVEAALQFLAYGGEWAATQGGDHAPARQSRSAVRTERGLPRTLTDRIPFEVVELIMGRMSQGCLGSCALVCQTWYQASIRTIYRDIDISRRAAFDSLADFALRDARAHARLAQTTSLRVGGSRSDVPVHAVPLIFARVMPNVRRLVFSSYLHSLMHPSFFVTLPVFRTVTALELFRFRMRCFGELQRIVAAFPRLKSLKLGVGVLETDAVSLPNVLPARARLERLALGWGLTPSLIVPLIRWLAESSACAALAHLAFWPSPLNMSLHVNSLLAVTGGTLLSIHEMDPDSDDGRDFWPSAVRSIVYDGDSPPVVSHCTFAHSPRLHTVRFQLRSCALDDEPSSKWQTAARELDAMLGTLCSPGLRHIKICQSMRLTRAFYPLSARSPLFYAELSPEALSSVHNTMAKPIYGRLESVEYSFDMEYIVWDFLHAPQTVAVAGQRLSSGIPHLLAPWHRRGLVKITQKTSPAYKSGRL